MYCINTFHYLFQGSNGTFSTENKCEALGFPSAPYIWYLINSFSHNSDQHLFSCQNAKTIYERSTEQTVLNTAGNYSSSVSYDHEIDHAN